MEITFFKTNCEGIRLGLHDPNRRITGIYRIAWGHNQPIVPEDGGKQLGDYHLSLRHSQDFDQHQYRSLADLIAQKLGATFG